MRLHADMIRELVDAFLSDHGGIHVGEEKRFAAAGRALHHDVDGRAGERRAHPIGERAAVDCLGVASAGRDKGNVGGNAGIEPDRRLRRRAARRARVRSRRHRARAPRDLKSGSRRRSWDDRPGSIKTGGAYRRGDRERQVGAGAGAWPRQLGGSIINADSMQVYRDLRIITARPAPAEEARVAHLLYGHVDAAENYSVGRWCVDARAALAAVERAGRLPIVVGGTGLYFKALTQGLAAVPPIPADIRSAVRDRLKARGHRAALCRAQRSRSGDRAASRAGRSRPHHPRARGGPGDRPLAHGLAPRRHGACARPPTARSRSSSTRTGRNSTAASMPASMRCWRPARSTRCARSAAAVSTSRCPP